MCVILILILLRPMPSFGLANREDCCHVLSLSVNYNEFDRLKSGCDAAGFKSLPNVIDYLLVASLLTDAM